MEGSYGVLQSWMGTTCKIVYFKLPSLCAMAGGRTQAPDTFLTIPGFSLASAPVPTAAPPTTPHERSRETPPLMLLTLICLEAEPATAGICPAKAHSTIFLFCSES